MLQMQNWPAEKIDLNKDMNQFVWNRQYPEAERIDGMILWNGVPGSTLAPPGKYFAKFTYEKDSVEMPFTILADPNYKITQQDYEDQFVFLTRVKDKFNEVQKAIKDIRNLRTQINDFVARQGKTVPKEIKEKADSINKHMTNIEETLYQTKAKSGQDVLNYPIRLNDKIGGVYDAAASGNMAPSKQARDVFAELSAQVDTELTKLKQIVNEEVPAFNKMINEKSLPVIGVNRNKNLIFFDGQASVVMHDRYETYSENFIMNALLLTIINGADGNAHS